MTDDVPHPLRSDALDNRQRILETARTLFATDGMDVTMRKIARLSGVGPATLYRRFPTKQMLVAEAFAEEVRMCHAIVDEGRATPDAWKGFCLVIEKTCELHARNRGFTEAFLSAFPTSPDFAAAREYSLTSIAELANQAKKTGRLRPDFVVDDLVLMLMAHRGIHATSATVRIAASRRFAAFTIQAFQTCP